MKAFIIITLLVLIAGAAVAISRNDQQADNIEKAGLVTYHHPEYGFSFDYPERATLYDSTNDNELSAPVDGPQLVRIVLPETYPNMRMEGSSLNYLLEVSLDDPNEPIESKISPEVLEATKDYRAQFSDGEHAFMITLDGVWLGGPEVHPSAREAFTTVRDSFEVAGAAQRP